MFEAQLGALRDIDFGIYPVYVRRPRTHRRPTRPSARASRAARQDCGRRHHEGLFHLRGRGPVHLRAVRRGGDRRCARPAANTAPRPAVRAASAAFDVRGLPLRRRRCRARLSIALTKLDVLSYLDKIPVCVRSTKSAARSIDNFPNGSALAEAKPHLRICAKAGTATSPAAAASMILPKAARDYVEMIEKAVGCPIKYVSVGAGRDEYIRKDRHAGCADCAAAVAHRWTRQQT